MTFDQPSTVLPASSPERTAFHRAFTALPSVNRRDFSGSTSPSGSGGGAGCGMPDFGASRPTGEVAGIGWAVFSSMSATLGSKKEGELSFTPCINPSTASIGSGVSKCPDRTDS